MQDSLSLMRDLETSASMNDDGQGNEHFNYEDSIIGILESICSVFDNIYLAKSLGIISEKNFLYRHLNKGDWGSRLWFVTLILSARKSINLLMRSLKLKKALQLEIESVKANSKGVVNDLVKEKLSESLNRCVSIIKDTTFELLQNLVYLFIVVIDLFRISLPPRWKRILEPTSNFITLLRFFTVGQAALRE